MNKFNDCHPNVHFHNETLTNFGVSCILTILEWNIAMDDWILIDQSLSKVTLTTTLWIDLQCPRGFSFKQKTTNNVGLTLGVSDARH